MAEKRMFSAKIIESDAFLDIPATAQMLYFHICMNTDDDGFVNNPRKIIRMCGASDDDLKILIDSKFLLSFDSGVVLVKHWRIHNYIPPDRYKPSCYVDEKGKVGLKQNGAYTTDPKKMVSPVEGNPKKSCCYDKEIKLDKR